MASSEKNILNSFKFGGWDNARRWYKIAWIGTDMPNISTEYSTYMYMITNVKYNIFLGCIIIE